MQHVEYRLEGAVAVVAFGHPPVNSLSHSVRSELAAALDRAAGDASVNAIVLTGKHGMFSGGADIREFGTPLTMRAPTLLDLIDAVEMSAKPIVAAVEGNCLGGGMELALAAHHRVAKADARLGLPEVKLGLLPGAGGTQRLPRLVGVETALNMILSGEPVPAKLLGKTPLLDKVVDGDPVAAAIDLASSVAGKGAAPRRTRDIPVREPNLEALCEFARNGVRAKFPNFPAPLSCIDAIEASAKPLDEGVKTERQLFQALMISPESKALRHLFFAERAAARVPDLPESTPVRKIERVAVIGAGTMGSGIAINFLNAGIPVLLLEMNQEALDRGVARIADVFDSQVRKKKLAQGDRDKRMGLLKPVLAYEAIGDADIVIEAVFEDMDVKRKVFETLDRVMKPGAILATNTSTLDINKLALVTKRPQDVIGTHFFSPANVMKLLEIVRGSATAPDVLATTLKLAKPIRKTAVVSGVCDGFIGNRMLEPYLKQALFLVEEGASPSQVDSAIEKFGFAMGPFRVSDLAGNDIGWHIRKRRAAERPDYVYPKIGDKICELGRFGQKTGAGWYDYPSGPRSGQPSKLVEELIDAHRREQAIKPRKIDNAEIVDRMVYALINEGAKILEEKIAARASDIDIVYITGYGFPVWRGGPMFYADQVGLYSVVRRMKQFAANPHAEPAFWTPAPLLARLAQSGGTFNAGEGAAV
jgi:3-hydroxyacyl-CoA dehydrogenase